MKRSPRICWGINNAICKWCDIKIQNKCRNERSLGKLSNKIKQEVLYNILKKINKIKNKT